MSSKNFFVAITGLFTLFLITIVHNEKESLDYCIKNQDNLENCIKEESEIPETIDDDSDYITIEAVDDNYKEIQNPRIMKKVNDESAKYESQKHIPNFDIPGIMEYVQSMQDAMKDKQEKLNEMHMILRMGVKEEFSDGEKGLKKLKKGWREL